tara:strand:+ start:249 stop:593 length:345 start_codon:yes stop_codon:yes gene_type:complete
MVSTQRLVAGITAVAGSADVVPVRFSLAQNFPNPFNGETVIRYALRTGGAVALTIYTLSGQEVRTWKRENAAAGDYAVQWDGRDEKEREVASGTYLYRTETADYLQQKKMLLLR